MATVKASRSYVKEVLRPKMYRLFKGKRFIPEAMSTSHVGRRIMERIKKRFPYMEYKRASINPRNPIDLADPLEKDIIKSFKLSNKEKVQLITRKNSLYLSRFIPIYAEKSCLKCHGKPEDAPKELIKIYGDKRGFYYKPGEIVAIDAVYIPVGKSLKDLRQEVISFFIAAFIAISFIFFCIHIMLQYEFLPYFTRLGIYLKSIISDKDNSIFYKKENVKEISSSLEDLALEVKRVHNELQKSEQKYRSLFESSQDAILMWNKERKIMDINPAALRFFCLTDKKEALCIETIEQFFWDHRDGVTFLAKLEKEGKVKDFETTVVNSKGDRYQVLITASKAIDIEGFMLFEGIFRDITEKKLIQRHILTTEKLAVVGQLAAGLAHEVNNSLSVIRCYANLIARGNSLPEQSLKDVEIIKKHVKMCQKILMDLLNFSRSSVYKKKYNDLNQLIREVAEVFSPRLHKQKITLTLELAENLPLLFFDKEKIKQVLMNIILNAIQAVKNNGRIIIGTFFDCEKQQTIIKIIDNGCGIPKSIEDKIFDPFFTTKGPGEGTGLGLSVSYKIIKDHGGKIFVESKENKETIFTIVLPMEKNNERDHSHCR